MKSTSVDSNDSVEKARWRTASRILQQAWSISAAARARLPGVWGVPTRLEIAVIGWMFIGLNLASNVLSRVLDPRAR